MNIRPSMCCSSTAAPDYLRARGRPRHPLDLASHDYVLHAMVTDGERFLLTKDGVESIEVTVKPAIRSDNSVFTGEAILAGVGIGLVHELLLKPLVSSGALEHVLPEWRYPPQELHAVYPSNRHIPHKVRVFVEGLARYLRGLDVFASSTAGP
ncbi:hypothetical protein I6F26_26075 [Ensifer sp. IC3342]|nr:hypothetical protein [Ensifer sp. BRP08]MCA1450029.1 hypothetical protein [Ensifer sp. IC3342]